MCAIMMVLLLLISGYGVASVPQALGELVADEGRVISVTSPDLPLEVGQPVPDALFGGDDLQIGAYRYMRVCTGCTGTGRYRVCSGGVSVVDLSGEEVAYHATQPITPHQKHRPALPGWTIISISPGRKPTFWMPIVTCPAVACRFWMYPIRSIRSWWVITRCQDGRPISR
jgi:hypothetical protein